MAEPAPPIADAPSATALPLISIPPPPKKSSLRRSVFGKDKKGKDKKGGGEGDNANPPKENVKFSLVEEPESAEKLPLPEGEDPSKYRKPNTSISRRTKKNPPVPQVPVPDPNDMPEYSDEMRNTGVDPALQFQYHVSAVTYQHQRTDNDLQTNIKWKVEQIQCTRNEVSVLLYRLDDLRRTRDTKLNNVRLMEEDREALQVSFVREMDYHIKANEMMMTKGERLKHARRRKTALDTKDKYVMQLYNRVHAELASTMRGYNECYSTVMCDTMKCLELWNGLQESYLEATVCMRESQQKAKQAYHAIALKFKRFKTIRETLARDLKTLKKQGKEEDTNNRAYYKEVLDYEHAKLRRYYDKLRCCLIHRDLRYEALLEKKDLLSAKVKVQIAALHKNFTQYRTSGDGAMEEFDLLIEIRKCSQTNFCKDTFCLLDDLPMEDDYSTHLEAIEVTLLGYTCTIRELDKKRECLLRDRASLLGINPGECVPIPTPCPYLPQHNKKRHN